MRKSVKVALVVVSALVLLGVFGGWYLMRTPDWAKRGVEETGRLLLEGAGGESDGLPSGEAIMDGYAAAMGSSGLAGVETRRVAFVMQLPIAGGLNLEGERYEGRGVEGGAGGGGRVYSETRVPFMGAMRGGSDGEVLWEVNPMSGGAKVFEGAERESRLQEFAFDAAGDWRVWYSGAERVGEMTVDGEACWMVELEPRMEGVRETRFYGKESGLLRKAESVYETDEGEFGIDRFYSGYEATDGVLYARVVRMVLGDEFELLTTVKSVEHGVEVGAGRFELPEEVRAVLEGGGAEE